MLDAPPALSAHACEPSGAPSAPGAVIRGSSSGVNVQCLGLLRQKLELYEALRRLNERALLQDQAAAGDPQGWQSAEKGLAGALLQRTCTGPDDAQGGFFDWDELLTERVRRLVELQRLDRQWVLLAQQAAQAESCLREDLLKESPEGFEGKFEAQQGRQELDGAAGRLSASEAGRAINANPAAAVGREWQQAVVQLEQAMRELARSDQELRLRLEQTQQGVLEQIRANTRKRQQLLRFRSRPLADLGWQVDGVW